MHPSAVATGTGEVRTVGLVSGWALAVRRNEVTQGGDKRASDVETCAGRGDAMR